MNYQYIICTNRKGLAVAIIPLILIISLQILPFNNERYFIYTSMESRILHTAIKNREVDIYLPSDYNKEKKYPVVYFNDGQLLFGHEDTYWNLQAKLDSLIREKIIRPVIVVGIYSNSNRMSDYIPYEDEWAKTNFENYQPNAKRYSDYIIKDVIPYIDSMYSTNSERALMGVSFGGLHATWTGLNYPDYFSMAAGFSPSWWVADHKIFEEANKMKKGQKVWFDVGTDEWNYYIPFIPKAGLDLGKDIFYFEVKDGKHNSIDWEKRVHNALIVFAGQIEGLKYTWDVQTEVIKSKSQANKFYLRLNPVISFENGLTYSLSTSASYKLSNTEDGIVNLDGAFAFRKPKDLEIVVQYNNEEKKVVVEYAKIEKGKMKIQN